MKIESVRIFAEPLKRAARAVVFLRDLAPGSLFRWRFHCTRPWARGWAWWQWAWQQRAKWRWARGRALGAVAAGRPAVRRAAAGTVAVARVAGTSVKTMSSATAILVVAWLIIMRTSTAPISFFATILSPLAFPLRPQRRRRAIVGPVQCLVNNSDVLKRMCLDVSMSKQRGKLVLSSAEEEQLRQF